MARIKISSNLAAAAITSIALHAVWLAHDAKAMHLPKRVPSEVLIEATELPVPPTEAKPEPIPPDNSRPEPALRTAPTQRSAEPRAALPSAAQAAKTLTAPETPGASDMADFSLVQGNGSEYAGGTTSSIGTSAQAVHGPASTSRESAPRAVTGNAPQALGPDLRRQATPNGSDWNCSSLFPSDPDAGDYATVLIAVTVLPTGKPKSVVVIRDPGHGFAA